MGKFSYCSFLKAHTVFLLLKYSSFYRRPPPSLALLPTQATWNLTSTYSTLPFILMFPPYILRVLRTPINELSFGHSLYTHIVLHFIPTFRNQLMWFNIYLAFLSYLQFTYQRGCLYRLKSLGLRNNEMDITIDGFHSWMWKGIIHDVTWSESQPLPFFYKYCVHFSGLSFLLPFLVGGYIW